jgi:hypothetical protein
LKAQRLQAGVAIAVTKPSSHKVQRCPRNIQV